VIVIPATAAAAATAAMLIADYNALFIMGNYETRTPPPLVPIADAYTYTALSQMSGDALRKFAEDFGLTVVYPTTPSISSGELERLDAMIEEASK
jgi:hypothetical protein